MRKALDEAGVSRAEVQGSGKDGRILKEDVPAAKPAAPTPAPVAAAPAAFNKFSGNRHHLSSIYINYWIS